MSKPFTKIHRPELDPEILELVIYFINGSGLTAEIAKSIWQSKSWTEKQRLTLYHAKWPKQRSFKAYPSSFDMVNGQDMAAVDSTDDFSEDVPF